jgi:hypothetical protein
MPPVFRRADMSEIAIDDALLEKARRVAAEQGYASLEEFVSSAVAAKVERAGRETLLASTGTIHSKLEAAGQTEAEVLDDFERFRDELWQKRQRGEIQAP